MEQTFFKIGDLVQRTGLTVRALHHYDAIGLLSPSARTPSGARRYGPQDLIRLHRIQAMKQLGYALSDIKATLDDAGVDPLDPLRNQIDALETQARRARKLSRGLQALVAQGSAGQALSATDWLDALEMMALHQKHFMEDEVQVLYCPRNAKRLEPQWAALVAEVARAMRSGLAPDSAQAHAMAWRWVRLVIAKTSNKPQLAIKLRALQAQESRAQAIVGVTAAMMAWVGQAIAFARCALFAKYLTPEQTQTLKERQLRMADMDRWPHLMVQVQAQFEAGTPVKDAAVQDLARQWQTLFQESYGGTDADMEARIRTAFAKEPDLMLGVGVTAPLMAYVREAMDTLAHQPIHAPTQRKHP